MDQDPALEPFIARARDRGAAPGVDQTLAAADGNALKAGPQPRDQL